MPGSLLAGWYGEAELALVDDQRRGHGRLGLLCRGQLLVIQGDVQGVFARAASPVGRCRLNSSLRLIVSRIAVRAASAPSGPVRITSALGRFSKGVSSRKTLTRGPSGQGSARRCAAAPLRAEVGDRWGRGRRCPQAGPVRYLSNRAHYTRLWGFGGGDGCNWSCSQRKSLIGLTKNGYRV